MSVSPTPNYVHHVVLAVADTAAGRQDEPAGTAVTTVWELPDTDMWMLEPEPGPVQERPAQLAEEPPLHQCLFNLKNSSGIWRARVRGSWIS